MNTDKKKTPQGAAQKFLFDAHSFDDDAIEEEEEEIPPPPTFSEEELEAARAESFAAGKQAGLDEAAASRETQIAGLVGAIKQNMGLLFAAEDERETRFETEAVHLARTVIDTVFPILNEKLALEDVERFIKQAISTQKDTPEITITVRPDDVEPLAAKIDHLMADAAYSGTYSITGAEHIGEGDCLLSWKDGGGRRNISALKEQIALYFEQTLAGKPRVVNNEDHDEQKDAPESGQGDQHIEDATTVTGTDSTSPDGDKDDE